MKRTITRWNET